MTGLRPDTEPSADALEAAGSLLNKLDADHITEVRAASWSIATRLTAAHFARFRAAGVREAYTHCLQLADNMTNQRALIRDLMQLAGVEKFKRTTKCLVCNKNPRVEDGGMLCQPCRDKVDEHPNMAEREWRPIESAPRDGEWVLTCIAGTLIPFVAAFDDEPGDPCWFSFNRAYETGCKGQPYQPTHWMPLLSIPGASP